MTAVFLIAGNFLREQRWLILLLMVWVAASSLLLGAGDPSLDDVLFFFHQQAVYGVAFGGFLAASAIYNERRSRRILSVLSKGIERRQYLAGLLSGIGAIEIAYALAMALGGSWMLRQHQASGLELGPALLTLFLAAMLVTSMALFFSTFLNPLMALACVALAAAIPAALAIVSGGIAAIPVYPLLARLMSASPMFRGSPDWSLLGLAAAEVVLFWLGASWIFARRDIAAAIE